MLKTSDEADEQERSRVQGLCDWNEQQTRMNGQSRDREMKIPVGTVLARTIYLMDRGQLGSPMESMSE